MNATQWPPRGAGARPWRGVRPDGRAVVHGRRRRQGTILEDDTRGADVLSPHDGEANAAVSSPDEGGCLTGTGVDRRSIWSIPEGEKLSPSWNGEARSIARGPAPMESLSGPPVTMGGCACGGEQRSTGEKFLGTRWSRLQRLVRERRYRVVSAGQDGTARVWDSTTGQPRPYCVAQRPRVG